MEMLINIPNPLTTMTMRMKFQIQKMTAWTLSKWLDEMGRNISANAKEDQLVLQDLLEWKDQEGSRENPGSEE